jgi:hypothetical protein
MLASFTAHSHSASCSDSGARSDRERRRPARGAVAQAKTHGALEAAPNARSRVDDLIAPVVAPRPRRATESAAPATAAERAATDTTPGPAPRACPRRRSISPSARWNRRWIESGVTSYVFAGERTGSGTDGVGERGGAVTCAEHLGEPEPRPDHLLRVRVGPAVPASPARSSRAMRCIRSGPAQPGATTSSAQLATTGLDAAATRPLVGRPQVD